MLNHSRRWGGRTTLVCHQRIGRMRTQWARARTRSEIYRMNRRGARTEPWGRPLERQTQWEWWDRKPQRKSGLSGMIGNQSRAESAIPIDLDRWSKRMMQSTCVKAVLIYIRDHHPESMWSPVSRSISNSYHKVSFIPRTRYTYQRMVNPCLAVKRDARATVFRHPTFRQSIRHVDQVTVVTVWLGFDWHSETKVSMRGKVADL